MANKQEKQSKVWYAVEGVSNLSDQALDFISKTLEEAYKAEIENSGMEGKKYAYKIELLGEVNYELTIKK